MPSQIKLLFPSCPGNIEELWYCHFMSEYDMFPCGDSVTRLKQCVVSCELLGVLGERTGCMNSPLSSRTYLFLGVIDRTYDNDNVDGSGAQNKLQNPS